MALLDPSIIARGSSPVEVPDPHTSMEAALKIQQMRQQNSLFPLRQQELQGQVQQTQGQVQQTQLENKQKIIDQRDQENFGKAQALSGGDPDKFIEAANQNITSPTILTKVEATANQMRLRNASITAKQHEQFSKMGVEYANDLKAVDESKDNPVLQLGLWGTLVKKLNDAKDEKGNALFPAGTLDPSNVPSSATIKMFQNVADATGEWHAKAAKLQEDSDKAAKASADLAKTQTETEGLRTQQAASLLSKSQTAEEYQSIKGTLDPKVAARFPDPPKGLTGPLSEDFLGNIRERGMTPDQQTISQDKKTQLLNAQRRAKEDLIKAGVDPDLADQATDPKATPQQRTAAAQKAIQGVSNLKIREEVGKQMGVLSAMMGGGFGGGGVSTPAPVIAPTALPATTVATPSAIPPTSNPEPSVIQQRTPPQVSGTQINPVTPGPTQTPPVPLSAPVVTPAPSATVAPASATPTPAATPTPSTNGRNEAYLDDLVKKGKINQGMANEIRAVAEGRLQGYPLQSRAGPMGMMTEFKKNILNTYDPAYDVSDPAARLKTARGFSPDGSEGKALNAAGTAMTHAGLLSDLIENLNNTSFPKYNSISNWIKNNTGSAEVKQFVNTRDKFADELSKAWGANALGDRQKAIDTLNAADSPESLRKVMADDIELLRGKTGELESQYKATMGKDLGAGKGVSDEAKKAADKVSQRRTGALPKGNGKAADEGVIRQYLNANSGDKDATRKALTDNGWTIPKAK